MRTLSETKQWTKAARGPSAGSPSSSAPTTTTWPSSGETSLYVGSPPKQTQTQLHADISWRISNSTKAKDVRYDNKTHHKCKQHTHSSVSVICKLTLIYTQCWTHDIHKIQADKWRLDMICYDSNSESFWALFNSRKSSVKTPFLEGEHFPCSTILSPFSFIKVF